MFALYFQVTLTEDIAVYSKIKNGRITFNRIRFVYSIKSEMSMQEMVAAQIKCFQFPIPWSK